MKNQIKKVETEVKTCFGTTVHECCTHVHQVTSDHDIHDGSTNVERKNSINTSTIESRAMSRNKPIHLETWEVKAFSAQDHLIVGV